MKPIKKEFYGDSFRWFIGVVEERSSDQPRLGRVKVRIYGIHGNREEIPVADLPYAQVLVPTTEPGVSGLGRNPMITEGATVFGIFLDGETSQLPLILGSIPVIEVPSIDQINMESDDEALNNTLKKVHGTIIGGTVGAGTGGTAGMKSALANGLDGWDYDATTGNNIQLAWEWLSLNGQFTFPVISGILGNFLVENGSGSPIDLTTNFNGSKIGIAGWDGKGIRAELLQSYAAERKQDPRSLYVQLEFVLWELATSPDYKSSELKTMKTPAEAALHVQRNYLNAPFSGGVSSIDGQKSRQQEGERVAYARMIYDQFTRKTN